MRREVWASAHRLALAAAAVSAVSIAVYLGAFRGGYVWDDWVLMDGSAIGGGTFGGCFTGSFLSHYYRPLVSLSFVVDRLLWPNNPVASHWVNVGAHAACSVAVLGMAYAAVGRLSVALAAGLLFAVHPAHVGAVAWIGGRTDALGALWTTLFAWSLIGAVRSRGDRRALLLAGSVFAYALAVFTKEQTLALLPLVPLAFACFGAGTVSAGASAPRARAASGAAHVTNRATTGRRPSGVELPGTGWFALGPYFVVTVLYLAMGVFLGMPKPPGLWVPLSEHLARAAETVAGYGALLLMPNQRLMHLFSLDAMTALRPWPVLAGSIATLGLPFMLARLWRSDRVTLWFVALIALALAPVSGVLPLPFILFAPYRASVAVIGLSVPLARWTLSLRRPFLGMAFLPAVAALSALAAWHTAQTIRGVATWETERTLFTAMVEHDPGAIVGHYMLARMAVDEGRDADAVRHLERILDRLYGVGAERHRSAGLPPASSRSVGLRPASERGGWNWRTPAGAVEGLREDWRVRARVMQHRGGVGDAEDYLTTLFIHLGYSRIGVGTSRGAGISSAVYAEAAAAFETALRWRPGDPDANLGLGWVRLESGLNAEAERRLRAALAADPDRADAMRLLALTLERQGKHPEAREYWRMWQNAVERASSAQMGLQTNR